MVPVRRNLGGRLRLIIGTVSVLQPRVQHLLRIVLRIPVVQLYGTSETGGVISIQHVADQAVDCVGGPTTACEVRLRDSGGRGWSAAGDRVGELMVRGANVFEYYHGNKSLTSEVLSKDGWFATGDIVELREDGSMEVKRKVTK